MFVATYRWRLYPELAHDFIAGWHRITRLELADGSDGSSLFKVAQGYGVASARWSSRAARAVFFEFQKIAGDGAGPAPRGRAALAIIERLPPQPLDSVLDAWAPFTAASEASRP